MWMRDGGDGPFGEELEGVRTVDGEPAGSRGCEDGGVFLGETGVEDLGGWDADDGVSGEVHPRWLLPVHEGVRKGKAELVREVAALSKHVTLTRTWWIWMIFLLHR